MSGATELQTGIKYVNTGESVRGYVTNWHGSPKPKEHHKTPYIVDIIGLKKADKDKSILLEEGYRSKFTIGYEIEKNELHRNAVKEYPLFSGFERDGSCGYEAITNILPLLPAGKWRNKVFNMFTEASKIIESSYSPANKQCGGHVTVTCNGKSPDEFRKAIRPFCGILHALFEKRMLNGYCNYNLRMTRTDEDPWRGYGWRGSERYSFCLEKYFSDGTGGLEFRIVSKFDSVKQCMRRYELFYALCDTAINSPRTTHEAFLRKIKPIILSMYGYNEAEAEKRIEKARHYKRFIMTGKLSKQIAQAVDPFNEHLNSWDRDAKKELLGIH